MSKIFMETKALKILFKPKEAAKETPKLYYTFLVMYPGIIRAIHDNMCPFCGRVFPKKAALKIHLRTNPVCKQILAQKINNVLDTYEKKTKRIRIRRTKKYTEYIVPIGRPQYKFYDIMEAIEFAIKNL